MPPSSVLVKITRGVKNDLQLLFAFKLNCCHSSVSLTSSADVQKIVYVSEGCDVTASADLSVSFYLFRNRNCGASSTSRLNLCIQSEEC